MFSYKLLKALSTIKICLYSFPTWSSSARTAVIFSQYHQQNRFHVNSVGNPRRVSDTTNPERFSDFLFTDTLWTSDTILTDVQISLSTNFPSRLRTKLLSKTQVVSQKDLGDGPVTDMECPQCSNSKATWIEAQLRSADEGRTIFYCCRKCRHRYATYKMP
jgi:DNA-directed RNA polymerase I subunit RPA12